MKNFSLQRPVVEIKWCFFKCLFNFVCNWTYVTQRTSEVRRKLLHKTSVEGRAILTDKLTKWFGELMWNSYVRLIIDLQHYKLLCFNFWNKEFYFKAAFHIVLKKVIVRHRMLDLYNFIVWLLISKCLLCWNELSLRYIVSRCQLFWSNKTSNLF